MSRVVKILKTLRNNWKKSTVAGLVLLYGADWGVEKYRVSQMMRVYCASASVYGDVTIGSGLSPRHITVLLNPTANGGKCATNFDKFCAPLLHIAGCEVEILKSENEGHARTLMNNLGRTDAVVIAGGDGTVCEVVTGLLRRYDGYSVSKSLPLAIIPLGRHNNSWLSTIEAPPTLDAEKAALATLAVLKDVHDTRDVIRIEGSEGKPVFAVNSVKWGPLRDATERATKLWFFGGFRDYAAYFFHALRKQHYSKEINIEYTDPCSGCSACVTNDLATMHSATTPAASAADRRWWHSFVPRKPQTMQSKDAPVDYSGIVNPACGVWCKEKLKTISLTFSTMLNYTSTPSIHVHVGPDSVKRRVFIKEGWKDANGEESEDVIKARSINILPHTAESETEEWLSIDSDNYELKPMTCTILPRQIRVFAPTAPL